jgi:uncharacterized protein
MPHEFVASRLDVSAFARAGAVLSGQDALSKFDRLMQECDARGADRLVQWTARGALLTDVAGQVQAWLHLKAQASLPLTCQRCLEPADIALAVDRSFRFVATEAQAEAEDEEAEEDVLALRDDLNLYDLIEDELLMALPVVPRHEACPGEVKLAVQDPDFAAASEAKPNPFATLAALKDAKGG